MRKHGNRVTEAANTQCNQTRLCVIGIQCLPLLAWCSGIRSGLQLLCIQWYLHGVCPTTVFAVHQEPEKSRYSNYVYWVPALSTSGIMHRVTVFGLNFTCRFVALVNIIKSIIIGALINFWFNIIVLHLMKPQLTKQFSETTISNPACNQNYDKSTRNTTIQSTIYATCFGLKGHHQVEHKNRKIHCLYTVYMGLRSQNLKIYVVLWVQITWRRRGGGRNSSCL